jgi:hypothetical protein
MLRSQFWAIVKFLTFFQLENCYLGQKMAQLFHDRIQHGWMDHHFLFPLGWFICKYVPRYTNGPSYVNLQPFSSAKAVKGDPVQG